MRIKCVKCKGTGHIGKQIYYRVYRFVICPDCKGTGKIKLKITLDKAI